MRQTKTFYCIMRQTVDDGEAYVFDGIHNTIPEAQAAVEQIREVEADDGAPIAKRLEWTDKRDSQGFLLATTEWDVFKIYEREIDVSDVPLFTQLIDELRTRNAELELRLASIGTFAAAATNLGRLPRQLTTQALLQQKRQTRKQREQSRQNRAVSKSA